MVLRFAGTPRLRVEILRDRGKWQFVRNRFEILNLMKAAIVSLLLVSTFSASVAGELEKLLLSEMELPKGVTFMEPKSVRKPEFLRGKNKAVFSDEATIKQFCAMFLRDEAFASNMAEVSITACRAPINDATVVGHRLKDASKAEELQKAYAFLISQVKFHKFFESENLIFIVWSNDDEAKKSFDDLASVVGGKLKSKKSGGAEQESGGQPATRPESK